MKSVWPVFYSFDPEMVLHFHFTFKPFLGHAQKRESERKKRAQPPKLTPIQPLTPIQLTTGHAKLTSPPILHNSLITEPNADPWSWRTASIAIARSIHCNLAKHHVDRDLMKHRADRSPSSNPVAPLSSFFSQFDRDLMIFFLGFVCVLRNEWYYVFIW